MARRTGGGRRSREQPRERPARWKGLGAFEEFGGEECGVEQGPSGEGKGCWTLKLTLRSLS